MDGAVGAALSVRRRPHPFHNLLHGHEEMVPDFRNHFIIGYRKEPAHVPLHALSGEEEGRPFLPENGWQNSRFLRLLTPPNTRWKFCFSPCPSESPAVEGEGGFPGADAWEDIAVPSCWECRGAHGQPIYTNFQYPFRVEPPIVPDAMNHVGSYQVPLRIPPDWVGRRVFLYFEGVASAFHAWVDGELVGYSQDSRLPAEFDITDVVRRGGGALRGEHTLSLRVYRFCDGSYLEDQDMWWLSGVQRDVLLYSKPAEAHIHDYSVKTDVLHAQNAPLLTSDVDVTVSVRLRGTGVAWPSDLTLHATLLGPCMLGEGDKMLPVVCGPRGPEVHSCRLHPISASRDGGWGASATMRVDGGLLWSAETPWLYTLVISLKRGGVCVDCEKHRVGLRAVRVEGNRVLLNGAAIEVRGVNRHEHDERNGKYTSRESILEDLALMKRSNINAVRTAHYPNRTLFYALCDAYGLYVCDEANIETHGLVLETSEVRLCNDPEWEQAYLTRMQGMVLRDGSHACVIIWSLGNESSYGRHQDTMAAWTRATDPSRPVAYEPCGGGSATDIIFPMYPSIERLRALTGLATQNARSLEIGRMWGPGTCPHTRPVLMCEYAHAMGNSTGNLDEYWSLIRSTDGLQGGFIWDWKDQGLVCKDATGAEFWGYGGDFGEAIHDAQFNVNGLVWPDGTPHPGLYQVKHTYAPVRVSFEWPAERRCEVIVHNGHNFIALSGLGWTWRLELDGIECARGDTPLPLRRHTGEEVLPGESLRAAVPIPDGAWPRSARAEQEHVLTVRVILAARTPWAGPGHEISWGQTTAPRRGGGSAAPSQSPPRSLSPGGGGGGMVARLVGAHVVVEGPGGLCVRVDTKRGGLVGFRHGGVDLVVEGGEGGCVQSFWRAHTDNDNGGIDMLAAYGSNQRWRAESGWREGRRRLGLVYTGLLAWLCVCGDTSYGLMWTRAGLDRLEPHNVGVSIVKNTPEEAEVRCKYTMRAPGGGGARIPCTTSYVVRASGDVCVINECDVAPHLPPLPRIGVRLTAPSALGHVTWFGRGPHEAYTDRQTGCPVGLYRERVEDTFVRYLKPSENGTKCGVRFAALTDAEGRGVLFAPVGAGEEMLMSAHHFTAHDLHNAKHPHEVPHRQEITVTLDHVHMPCGGNDSWSRAHLPEYLIKPGRYRYAFLLRPITSHAQIRRPEPGPGDDDAASSYSPPGPFSAWVADVRTRTGLVLAKVPIVTAEVAMFASHVRVLGFSLLRVLLVALLFIAAIAVVFSVVFTQAV